MVTSNARDFLDLLDVELHAGLIILRETGLTRDEQWQRLELALDHVQTVDNHGAYMINRVIEIRDSATLAVRQLPPAGS